MASECVKVMVRCRPMNRKEKEKGCNSVVEVDVKENTITLHKPGEADQSKQFSYDYTFGSETPQQTIYETTAFQLIESVVEGYNGTIFAYGQTGCGKTHTMLGDPTSDAEKGIIPRSFQHIMNIVQSANNKQFLVRCSYLEIYNEDIRDLLGQDAKAKVDLKESPDKGVFVKDLTQNIVKNVEEMEKWMIHGTKNRSVGETLMNQTSSRSHSIFTLYIEASINDELGNERYTAGKLNLVDLAGSERQSKTGATGDRLKEATKINLSLSALGNVISALVDGKSQHVPYRDSKLTRLLQDSLGGNTKTIMIAAISPADYNYDETLSTLRYAARAKNIKNKPTVNEDPKDAMLRQYGEEIKKLKEMLLRQQNGEKIDLQAEMLNSQQIVRGDSMLGGQIEAMKQELEEKAKKNEEALLKEQNERIRLQELISQMSNKLVTGGQGDEKQKQKYQKLKNHLKQNEQQKNQLIQEKEKAENEVLNMNKKFSNLQEENQELHDKYKKIRNKYKQALNEIKDIERENEQEKEDYLELIRIQEKELKFYQQMAHMLLTQNDIDYIKKLSPWNEEKKEFSMPYFFLKEKSLKLPQLHAQEITEAEKENRELVFRQSFSRGGFGRQNNQNGSYGRDESYDKVDEMRQTQNNKFIIRNANKTIYSGNNLQNQSQQYNGTKNSFYNGDARPMYEYDPTPPTKGQSKKEPTKVPKMQLDPLGYEAKVTNQNIFQQNGQQNGLDRQKIPKTQLEPLNHNAHIDQNQNSSQMNGTRNNFYQDENQKQKQGRGIRLESIQSQNHMRNVSQNSQVQYDASYDLNKIGVAQKNNKQMLNPIQQPKQMKNF